MVKNERSRNTNQNVRAAPTATDASFPPPPPLPMFQSTSRVLSQRIINPKAIDITSLKGQFAWEKIPKTDTYMPVIFRYVNCVHMFLEFTVSQDRKQ